MKKSPSNSHHDQNRNTECFVGPRTCNCIRPSPHPRPSKIWIILTHDQNDLYIESLITTQLPYQRYLRSFQLCSCRFGTQIAKRNRLILGAYFITAIQLKKRVISMYVELSILPLLVLQYPRVYLPSLNPTKRRQLTLTAPLTVTN